MSCMIEKKRKIIVTGSEGLLGSEISKYFESKNDTVIKLDIKLGHDLSNEKFTKTFFKKHTSNYLVNCFALNDHIDTKRKKGTLFNFPLEEFRSYLELNIVTLFSVCREFAKNNNSGSIVNFSSTYGIDSPHPDLYEGSHKDIGYGVSKAGVLNLTKYLSVHLAPKFRVNCVVPGGVKNNQSSSFIKKYSQLTPMKRMMRKSELNGIIDYLCSSNSSYVTGSSFIIDGGYLSW